DGLGSNATAAHFALSAGIIRAQELVAGRIEHGLGDGLGSNATAAHFALSAGIIRAQELVAGRIEHGL
ncbi:hypothetical protein, partial [Streptococcus pneumoniae]|uniref:hypothetical protein n=1 Tax=Streptococcus pneumoniae TaxID=1313 RepID=UPI001CB7A007